MRINYLKKYLRQSYRDLRTAIFRFRFGCRSMHPKSYVIKPRSISKDVVMGAYSHLSVGCRIGMRVKMGNYVMCGPEVEIAPGEHRFDLPGVPIIFSGRNPVEETIIEDDVWIGARAMIRSGVRVGRGAIVGMGAVVVKDVDAYTIVGGVPARKVATRFKHPNDALEHDEMINHVPRQGEYCE